MNDMTPLPPLFESCLRHNHEVIQDLHDDCRRVHPFYRTSLMGLSLEAVLMHGLPIQIL